MMISRISQPVSFFCMSEMPFNARAGWRRVEGIKLPTEPDARRPLQHDGSAAVSCFTFSKWQSQQYDITDDADYGKHHAPNAVLQNVPGQDQQKKLLHQPLKWNGRDNQGQPVPARS